MCVGYNDTSLHVLFVFITVLIVNVFVCVVTLAAPSDVPTFKIMLAATRFITCRLVDLMLWFSIISCFYLIW